MLIRWYETKCFEGKIRYYGIAFEFMVEEPFENKWHIEIERIKNIARKVSGEKNHLNTFCLNIISCVIGLTQ